MQFFTQSEFVTKYPEFATEQIPTWKIEAVCEIIFSQIGLIYRDASWDTTSVPLCIKNASMEQLRFMYEYDIPFIDYDKKVKAGTMEAELKSDLSTLALRMLGNGGYLFRGNPMYSNMGLNVPFGN